VLGQEDFFYLLTEEKMIPRRLKPANFIHDGKKNRVKNQLTIIKVLSETKVGLNLEFEGIFKTKQN
jgi:hypothetical protein